MKLENTEKHAIVDAATEFSERGMDFHVPWESDLDDLERERFEALVAACRAYHKAMSVFPSQQRRNT